MKLPKLLKFLRQITVIDNRRELPSMASEIDATVIYNAVSVAEQQGRTRELFSLYRDMLVTDGHAQSEFAKRKLAVVNEPLMVLPFEKKNALDMQASDGIKAAISDCDDLIRGLIHALDSSLYPVACVEKVFTVTTSGAFRLRKLVPVPHTLLDFTDGMLKIRNGLDPEDLSKAVAPDPNRYIVHRGNLMTLPDQWGGPFRSVLFWWLLSVCDRSWWSRFLEKYGSPFMVGKYDPNDDQSRTVLERAFGMAARLGGLAITRDTEIELKQAAATDAGEAFERFHAVANREKSKIIIGQTLSSDAQSTGMNSGVASLQGEVRADIRRFDASFLSETLRRQLFAQIHAINRLPGRVPTAQFGAVQNDSKTMSLTTMLQQLRLAGLEVDDSGLPDLSEMVSLPIRRAAIQPASPLPFSAAALSAQDIDAVARSTAPDLARAFRGSHAEIARIIRESKSSDDCRELLQAFTAALRPGQAADIVQAGLTAYAANGLTQPFSRGQS